MTPYQPQMDTAPQSFPAYGASRPTSEFTASQRPFSQAELAVMHPEDSAGDSRDPDWRYYHAATVR